MGRGKGQGVRGPTVNLVALIARELDIDYKTARSALSHGQVCIDGACVESAQQQWPYEELAGKMLRVYGRETRMLGGRRAPSSAGDAGATPTRQPPILRLESQATQEALFA